MGDDIWSIEPPRWLQAITAPDRKQQYETAQTAGVGLGALAKTALSDPNVNPASGEELDADSQMSFGDRFDTQLAMGQMQRSDPQWRAAYARIQAQQDQTLANYRLEAQREELNARRVTIAEMLASDTHQKNAAELDAIALDKPVWDAYVNSNDPKRMIPVLRSKYYNGVAGDFASAQQKSIYGAQAASQRQAETNQLNAIANTPGGEFKADAVQLLGMDPSPTRTAAIQALAQRVPIRQRNLADSTAGLLTTNGMNQKGATLSPNGQLTQTFEPEPLPEGFSIVADPTGKNHLMYGTEEKKKIITEGEGTLADALRYRGLANKARNEVLALQQMLTGNPSEDDKKRYTDKIEAAKTNADQFDAIARFIEGKRGIGSGQAAPAPAATPPSTAPPLQTDLDPNVKAQLAGMGITNFDTSTPPKTGLEAAARSALADTGEAAPTPKKPSRKAIEAWRQQLQDEIRMNWDKSGTNQTQTNADQLQKQQEAMVANPNAESNRQAQIDALTEELNAPGLKGLRQQLSNAPPDKIAQVADWTNTLRSSMPSYSRREVRARTPNQGPVQVTDMSEREYRTGFPNKGTLPGPSGPNEVADAKILDRENILGKEYAEATQQWEAFKRATNTSQPPMANGLRNPYPGQISDEDFNNTKAPPQYSAPWSLHSPEPITVDGKKVPNNAPGASVVKTNNGGSFTLNDFYRAIGLPTKEYPLWDSQITNLMKLGDKASNVTHIYDKAAGVVTKFDVEEARKHLTLLQKVLNSLTNQNLDPLAPLPKKK